MDRRGLTEWLTSAHQKAAHPAPHRPPLRLARRSAPLGAAGRLGGEVAAARAPGRVVRSATRLTAGPPPAAAAPAAPEPSSAGSRARRRPPLLRPRRPRRPRPPQGDPGGHVRLAGGVDPGGRRRQGGRDVGAPGRGRRPAREAPAQPRRAHPRGSGDAVTPSRRRSPEPSIAGRARRRRRRWRGARRAEVASRTCPSARSRSTCPTLPPDPSELSIPPMPGLGTAASEPAPKPAGGSRIGRAPAGSAHSTPAPDGPKAPPAPPSIMRTAATPARPEADPHPAAPSALRLRRRPRPSGRPAPSCLRRRPPRAPAAPRVRLLRRRLALAAPSRFRRRLRRLAPPAARPALRLFRRRLGLFGVPRRLPASSGGPSGGASGPVSSGGASGGPRRPAASGVRLVARHPPRSVRLLELLRSGSSGRSRARFLQRLLGFFLRGQQAGRPREDADAVEAAGPGAGSRSCAPEAAARGPHRRVAQARSPPARTRRRMSSCPPSGSASSAARSMP